ncbi:4Fe-4S binding protein [Thermosipho ferrireducens]|uniref:4Fe-4S binding protein n=1 Tax=Thermosipho ferrireducens TaxID=2571116 RepID=A0ABX7SAA8_9BACT|nr:monomeric [FeFe] hydrogenase [Thermosipho ferrireducens]QTA38343.1 4Fe-4S binding protein [Thermosipho ferrireducens]
MRKLVLNNIMKIRRKLYLELVRSYKNGKLKEVLPRLPKMIIPDNDHFSDKIRKFYEREIVKEKIKFALGLDYSKVKDMELYEILPFLEDIIRGESELLEKEKFVEVIREVCSECPGGKYYVTDLCRNCVAHSCVNVCPKNAISIVNNRANIDYGKCINCGLCAAACPYYAIIKLERPCESVCFSKAILFSEEGHMEIVKERCYLCGACYVACPFGAIETPSQIMQVVHKLLNKEKLIAIYAPSAITQFGSKVSLQQFRKALKNLGFSFVFEVAVGADMVAEAEAEHFLNTKQLMLTSCCPAFVYFVEKKFPDFLENVSPISSPMVALAQKLRKEFPDYKIVFIGPCIAKKKEAEDNNIPDYVLTFEETVAIFAAFGIEPMLLEEENLEEATPYAWKFAASGGVAGAVEYYIKKLSKERLKQDLNLFSASGIEECIKGFKEMKSGKLTIDIFEGMACDGGCIAGPCILVDPRISLSKLKKVFFT